MPANKPAKKYYTAAQANATLPLVRSIVLDITNLARQLRDRQERLARAEKQESRAQDPYQEELEQVQAELDREQERMAGYLGELNQLGIELKDYFNGLIDFPCWMDNREVYLCWRLGEPEVGHWHELDAGFAGRKKLTEAETRTQTSAASAPNP